MFWASFAIVSTAAKPFLVSMVIAPNAIAPIAAPNRATFLAMPAKPFASRPIVPRTPFIFLRKAAVRALTFINRLPTVAI